MTAPAPPPSRRPVLSAASGAAAVALFLGAAVVIGERPGFDVTGAKLVDHLVEDRTRIQVGAALIAAAAPLLAWFLATVAALATDAGPGAGRAGTVAYACGLVFLAVFLVDVSTYAAAALRPATAEVAVVLRDIEFMAMGMAAPIVSALLLACAVIALRHRAVWPRWVGALAAVAAFAYALRTGTLFTTDGPFAADGVLGLWVPVGAFVAWVLVASAVLVRRAGAAPCRNRDRRVTFGRG